MVAKTFDTNDPDHYEAYLAESVIQITLYGGVYLIRGEGGWITVYDGAELAPEPIPEPVQPGFIMIMDDGNAFPVPAPGGGS